MSNIRGLGPVVKDDDHKDNEAFFSSGATSGMYYIYHRVM